MNLAVNKKVDAGRVGGDGLRPSDADAAGAGADEARLLARFAAGAPGAARELTDRFLPMAYRLARRMLDHATEAEDVAQEAMVRLFRQAPVWQAGGAKVSTWLYRVTANLCTDRLRRPRHLSIEAALEVPAGAPGAEERLTEGARLQALYQSLAELPERQRLAVVLSQIEGLSHAEVASVLECGIEAVESLIARGKRGLAARLMDRRAALGYGDSNV